MTLNYEYIKLFLFITTCFFLVLLLFLVAYILAPFSLERDKETPYECGFHPFEDSRKEFNVHFYVVALLFVIFDVELILLIPFLYDLHNQSLENFLIVIIFLMILLIGFIYEWQEQVLDW